MVLIPAATFVMGSTNRSNAQPLHPVTLAAFWMDTTEVTQDDFERLMGVNPAKFKTSPMNPLENETWYDAVLYCNARSRRDGLDSVYSYDSIEGPAGRGCSNLVNLVIGVAKNGYHLPTEAQWEYACRGGSSSTYYWGDLFDSTTASRYAWYSVNAAHTTHPVASLAPNAFGLYDMSGNVYEWCNDWYGSYTADSQTDPTGPTTGTSRISRGGSWYEGIDKAESAIRFSYYPEYAISYNNQGFRCVRQQ